MTGTGTPSSDDASGDVRRRSRHRSILLAVVALVVAVGVFSDGSDPPPLAEGATLDPIASELVSPAGAAGAEAAPDLEAALIGSDDLPEGWAAAGAKLGRMRPDEGFCDRSIPAASLLDVVSAPFERGTEGPWVVSAVQTHTTPEAADAYLDALATTATCGHWVDDSGVGQRVETKTGTTPVGAERSLGFVQLSESATSTFRAEITYLRHGRAVALVAIIHAGATADREPDPAIARLAQTMAERLPAAVR